MKHLLYSALAIILLGVSIPMTIKAGNPDSTTTKKSSYTPRKSGWYMTINLEPVAVNVNQKTWAAPMSLVSISTGYQICPYIAIGGGIGYRWKAYRVKYEPDWAEEKFDFNNYIPVVPVFLDVCVNLNNKRVVPYIPITIGYNIVAGASKGDATHSTYSAEVTNAEATAFTSIGFGMKVHMGKTSTWNLAATLTAEKFKYDLEYAYMDHGQVYGTSSMNQSYLLFALSTGFTF